MIKVNCWSYDQSDHCMIGVIIANDKQWPQQLVGGGLGHGRLCLNWVVWQPQPMSLLLRSKETGEGADLLFAWCHLFVVHRRRKKKGLLQPLTVCSREPNLSARLLTAADANIYIFSRLYTHKSFGEEEGGKKLSLKLLIHFKGLEPLWCSFSCGRHNKSLMLVRKTNLSNGE